MYKLKEFLNNYANITKKKKKTKNENKQKKNVFFKQKLPTL